MVIPTYRLYHCFTMAEHGGLTTSQNHKLTCLTMFSFLMLKETCPKTQSTICTVFLSHSMHFLPSSLSVSNCLSLHFLLISWFTCKHTHTYAGMNMNMYNVCRFQYILRCKKNTPVHRTSTFSITTVSWTASWRSQFRHLSCNLCTIQPRPALYVQPDK